MTTTPAPQFRIEWFGSLQVFQPVAPQPQPTVDAHSLRRELSVASA